MLIVVLLLTKGGGEINVNRYESGTTLSPRDAMDIDFITYDNLEFGLKSWVGANTSKGNNWEITE